MPSNEVCCDLAITAQGCEPSTTPKSCVLGTSEWPDTVGAVWEPQAGPVIRWTMLERYHSPLQPPFEFHVTCPLSLSLFKLHHCMRASQPLPKMTLSDGLLFRGSASYFYLKSARRQLLARISCIIRIKSYLIYTGLHVWWLSAYHEVRRIISRISMEIIDSSWEEILCSVPSKTVCKRAQK